MLYRWRHDTCQHFMTICRFRIHKLKLNHSAILIKFKILKIVPVCSQFPLHNFHSYGKPKLICIVLNCLISFSFTLFFKFKNYIFFCFCFINMYIGFCFNVTSYPLCLCFFFLCLLLRCAMLATKTSH